MIINCPNCKGGLSVPDTALGKKIRCPRCQTVVQTTPPKTPEILPEDDAHEPADSVRQAVTSAAVSSAAVSSVAATSSSIASGPPARTGLTDTSRNGDSRPVGENGDDQDAETYFAERDQRLKKRRKKKKSSGSGFWANIPGIHLEPGLQKLLIGVVSGIVLIIVMVVALRGMFRYRPAPEIPEGQWTAFNVPGRCKVKFPAAPKKQTQHVAGLEVIMYQAQHDKDSIFGLGYSENRLPPERAALPQDRLLNDACDGSSANLKKMGCIESSRTNINLGPHRGKQLVMHVPAGGGYIISRNFVVNGRMYIAMCGGTGYDEHHPNVRRFLDSFDIIDDGAPPAVVQGPDAPIPGNVDPVKPDLVKPELVKPDPVNPLPEPGEKPKVVRPVRPKQPQPEVKQPEVKQPEVKPAVAKLELPPLPDPLEITPAPIKAETPVTLPEPARALRVGGGGRFLILHFPKARNFGIFDANTAKVVRYIPAAEDDVFFAGGMTKLMVYLPGAKVLQRFNLLTGEREKVGPLDVAEGKIEAFCMGHASAGPLLLGVAGQGPQLLDPETFKPITIPTTPGGGRPLDDGNYWAGASGRIFGHTGNWGQPNGVRTVILEESGVRKYGEHKGTWFVMPGPDDRHVYAGGHGVVTDQVRPVSNVPYSMGPNSGFASHLYLPAHHGPYYLHAMTIEDFGGTDKTPIGTIRLYVLGSKEPILTLPKTAVCKYGWEGLRGFGIEHSLHLIPKAKLLVIVPESRAELRLYPVDMQAALDKSGRDFLLFTSAPPGRFEKGAKFVYQAEVLAKRRPVTFKLESAPPGMTVDDKGKITWAVPEDFAESRVSAILSATDAGGQEAFQTLVLVERKTP